VKEYFEIGLNSYGFKVETGLIDFYITPTGLVLGVAVIVALRVRKVLKTRKAGK
jgi:hypothetical protein